MAASFSMVTSEADLHKRRKELLAERLLAYRQDLSEWFSGMFIG